MLVLLLLILTLLMLVVILLFDFDVDVVDDVVGHVGVDLDYDVVNDDGVIDEDVSLDVFCCWC